MTREFWIFGCQACHAHWWEWRREDNRKHDCPKGYPAGGMLIDHVPATPPPTNPYLKAVA